MKVSTGTAARTIWLIIVLANQALSILGKDALPFAEEEVYQLISLIFTISAALTAWWKNNSFTKSAIAADAILHKSKTQNKI